MMWEGEAAETKYLPGLLEIYVNLTAAKKYAEESSTEVWYMIFFMLIVNLNLLLQGSCTIDLCSPLKS